MSNVGVPSVRPQPMIDVVDVEKTSRWYQQVLGATGGHGGRSAKGVAVSQQPAVGGTPARPPAGHRRWNSFIADDSTDGKVVRGLHEETNPRHRLRVEYDAHTLLIHLSDEDGGGWTTIAVDRVTRQWAVAQDFRQADTARGAYDALYEQ